MPYGWKWQAQDKHGNIVEAAPGKPFFFSRGPSNPSDAIRAANILLECKRTDAVRFGLEDPGYELVPQSLEAVDEPESPIIGGLPRTPVEPLNLPIDGELNARHMELIEQHGG